MGVIWMVELIRKYKDNFLGIAILVGAYVVLCLMGDLVINVQTDELKEADALYGVRMDEREQALADIDKKTREYQSSVSGTDADRLESDKIVAETMLGTMLTWGDYEGYVSSRTAMMEQYGIDMSSETMAAFMPEVLETEPTADGSVYNKIDVKGVNCRFEKMEQHLVGQVGDVNSYFTIVKWSTLDKYGNEAMANAAFLYDLDGEGRFSNVSAYTLARNI